MQYRRNGKQWAWETGGVMKVILILVFAPIIMTGCLDLDRHTRPYLANLGDLAKVVIVMITLLYLEAAPVLVDSAYFLLDQTKASSALIAIDYLFEHGALSPWLVRLLQGTRRLVLSKPGEAVFWNARPIFASVERVEMFGFYPTLNRWVKRDRTIPMGWAYWYWKIFWYRSRMRPTKNPQVNLSRIAEWLHANLDQPSKRPGLCLHAWELEDDDGTEGCGKAYYVTVDLDTKEVFTKERIMFRTKLDRCGTLLENHLKQYHDFVRVTNERRNEWLREERRRWPELYSVTAIGSEAEK
ncbi:hypothetical protein DV735_g1535, partial [Chaetothyriales sp. CBS 134920]